MRAAAAAGVLVERGGATFELAEMRAWREERTVRAAVLRYLLIEDQWPVDARGVRLCGVRISGRLDLSAATVRCQLSLDRCYLDGDEPACLDHASVSVVALTGCQLPGLSGDMLSCRELDLTRSALAGPLRLRGADIAGQLTCSGATVTGRDSDGNAVFADAMKVGGSVLLGGGFTAAGAVRLDAAEITGALVFRGATVTGRDTGGNAVRADAVKAGRGVFLDGGFTAAGAIRLPYADITGQLVCRGATLNGHDSTGQSLVAFGVKVTGGVFINEGFTAAGAVRLDAADIAGELSCSGAALTGHDANGCALVADGIKVGGAVFIDGGFTAAGTVSLISARMDGSVYLRPAWGATTAPRHSMLPGHALRAGCAGHQTSPSAGR